MFVREHGNDAPRRPFRKYFRSTAITLIKSRLLQLRNFNPFRGFVAPPSRLQTRSITLHGRPPDPVRWRVSAPSLLPAARLAPAFPGQRALCATQQHLQYSRDVVSPLGPDHPRVGPSGRYRPPAPEWCFPGSHRVAGLSQSRHLRRFLRQLGIRGLAKLRRVHDHLLTQLWQRPKAQRRVIFDLDSTLLTLYGHQEQARIGYNPRQQGRPSYHPWSASRPRREISGMANCAPATCTQATEA